jgi:hypothetical protein
MTVRQGPPRQGDVERYQSLNSNNGPYKCMAVRLRLMGDLLTTCDSAVTSMAWPITTYDALRCRAIRTRNSERKLRRTLDKRLPQHSG